MKYLCVCLMGFAVAAFADQSVTRDEVARQMETVAKSPHPRLFATAEGFAELKARIPGEELLRLGAEAVRADANQILSFKPLTRIQTGRRLLTVSRNALYRISTLAMTYRLYGGDTYLNRAREELLAVARFSDWNPSHFLDVAEMSLATAIGYDWLYNELDAAAREEIAAGLTRHGIQTSLRPPVGWWVRAGNNWGQVCHAGLIAASLALAERDTDAAATVIHRAVTNLPRPMSAYAPNGCYPEGPGYWSYGTDFNVIAIDLLEKCLGTDFGLTSLPGFRETGAYLDLVTGPSGKTFNYADGGSTRGSNCAIWWFAKRFARPDLLAYFERAAYRDCVQPRKRGRVSESGGGNRLFPLTLFWLQPVPDGLQPKAPLLWNSGGPQPITIQRNGWDNRSAFFVGLKAGSPSGNHGHMDGGSFVLDAAGIRWAYDLGGENYHKIESRNMRLWDMRQNSDRWRIYRLATDSHNTLMINGCQQRVKGAAKVTVCEQAGDRQRVELDLSGLYTNATRVVRSGTLDTHTGTYTMTDTLRGLKPGDTVRWAMVTAAQPTFQGQDLFLAESGRTLHLVAETTPAVKWEAVPAAGPAEADWNSPNKGFTQVRLLLTAPASGEAGITVTFKLVE
ncbi:MAG: heparinase II/III family protein [Kiritimatiellae bacterium]|nr:heparinase II/III family protein [Kiritimatiellia bacterium]